MKNSIAPAKLPLRKLQVHVKGGNCPQRSWRLAEDCTLRDLDLLSQRPIEFAMQHSSPTLFHRMSDPLFNIE
jgi:hypothetical protein